MISREEILKGKECPPELEANLSTLLDKINQFRTAYNNPLQVTSGFRDIEDMKRIYKGKPYPEHSKHLFCQAVDLFDPTGELKKWVLENMPLMESIGLWFEDFEITKTWLHAQIIPPASGIRVFKI